MTWSESLYAKSLLELDEERPAKLLVPKEKANILSMNTNYVQVHDGELACRLREGIPKVADYLGFRLEEIDRTAAELVFRETASNRPNFPLLSVEGLNQRFFGAAERPEDLAFAPERIWKAHDRHENLLFLAVLGTAGTTGSSKDSHVLHRVQSISVEEARPWEDLFPDMPGSGAFVTMLGAYAEETEYVQSPHKFTMGNDGFSVRASVVDWTRMYYARLGGMLSKEGAETLPSLTDEEMEKSWWLLVSDMSLRRTTRFLRWFGGEEVDEVDDEGMREAVARMSNGLVCHPSADDSLAMIKQYNYQVNALARIWSETLRPKLESERDPRQLATIIPSKLPIDEFFSENGGEDMMKAILDGVPAKDVFA